jgi:hypothetical protein
MDEATDEDIYKAVVEAYRIDEGVGGSDEDVEHSKQQ